MYKFLRNLSCLLCLTLIFAGCRKQAFDDYYGRPDNLQPPIYQVLTARGNFTNLLQVIDRSGYKPVLSAAGYWTFFAPNDAAFQKYFTANNTSIDKIDSTAARKMITYLLVFNAFQTNHIADFQSNVGWVPNDAFKRRTAYYDGFYTGQGPDGAQTVLISSNRNANNNATSFIFGDNNNKYIPYFYSTYMAAKNLSATDYNYFFPNTTYSGFNVANASVVAKDILAENGVIHELDAVVTAPPSLEQQLASNDNYSAFKNLLERFMVTYAVNPDATRRYFTLSPANANKNVYVKQYSNLLAFAPNNENHMKIFDNDGQQSTYTMFVPNNTAFNNYLNNTILEFYKTIEALPPNIVADIINAHMWQAAVWPSKFATTNSYLGEPARFNPSTDVTEKKVCSNGFFYGTNKVQAANVFSTIYARAYLDPKYSITARLLDINLRLVITSPQLKYTMFMISDDAWRALGYDYNTSTSTYTVTVNGTTTSGNTARDQMLRILNLNVIPTPANEMNSLAGDGIIETQGGEYIRWHNNTVSSAGTVEDNQILNVVDSREYSNGKVYFLSGNQVMDYPVKTVAANIQANAGTAATPGPYYDFYTYLLSSTAYDAARTEIAALQLGASYTIFIPTRDAMKKAVEEGFLPGTVNAAGQWTSFTYNPGSPSDKDKVSRFISYHILNGINIAPDGKKGATGGSFPTLLKNSNGDVLNVVTFNQPNNLRLRDNLAKDATVLPPNNNSYFPATSNYLGTKTLLHQIDNFLRYTY